MIRIQRTDEPVKIHSSIEIIPQRRHALLSVYQQLCRGAGFRIHIAIRNVNLGKGQTLQDSINEVNLMLRCPY